MSSSLSASSRPSSLRAFALSALIVGFASGCRGYYANWNYAPSTQIHELHLGSSGPDGTSAKESPATIAVAVRLVGILRPADGAARRLHFHVEVENRGADGATFDPAATRATPSGALPLLPEPGTPLPIATGERRSAEIYVALPDPATLPNASLAEIDFAWTVVVAGRELTSHTTFRRASIWYGDPWYDDPWGYGYPYYYGYYGPYYPYGPYFGPCHGPW